MEAIGKGRVEGVFFAHGERKGNPRRKGPCIDDVVIVPRRILGGIGFEEALGRKLADVEAHGRVVARVKDVADRDVAALDARALVDRPGGVAEADEANYG